MSPNHAEIDDRMRVLNKKGVHWRQKLKFKKIKNELRLPVLT